MTALDDKLQKFLDECESERALGFTKDAILAAVRRVSDAQVEHEKNDVERFAKVDVRLTQTDYRLGSVETTAAKVEAKAEKLAEDTGNHRIIVAESGKGTLVRVLLALMAAALAVVGGLLIWALTGKAALP